MRISDINIVPMDMEKFIKLHYDCPIVNHASECDDGWVVGKLCQRHKDFYIQGSIKTQGGS